MRKIPGAAFCFCLSADALANLVRLHDPFQTAHNVTPETFHYLTAYWGT